MGMTQTVFWISTSLIALFYAGYYTLCKYVVSKKGYGVDIYKGYRPSVSMIIPTWNEASTIRGKLEDTLSLDYPLGKTEIIVIDSGSSDGTAEIVQRFAKKYKRVSLIKERDRKGKAHAVNKAVRRAKGDIVVMTDSDCRLKADVLKKSLPYFNDPAVGAVTGQERIINKGENHATKTEGTYRGLFYLIREAESKLDSTYIQDGPFFAFRRSLFTKLPRNSVADDSELGLLIKKTGARVLSIPEATYYEYAPSRMSERTKQKSRRAEGITQTMKNHFTTFFLNPSYGIFGLLIFPAGFFMHIFTPLLMLAAAATFLTLPPFWVFSMAAVAAVGLVVPKTRSIAFTFVHSQYASLLGIIKHVTKSPDFQWDKIENTRRYLQ